MDLKLNIYSTEKKEGKRVIEKTYTTNTYSLLWGTVEDFLNILELNNAKSMSNEELINIAFNLVTNAKDKVNELLLDVFDGITEAELRMATFKDIVDVLIACFKYSIASIDILRNSKNA